MNVRSHTKEYYGILLEAAAAALMALAKDPKYIGSARPLDKFPEEAW